MGKTRRKDKTFEDNTQYEELHEYASKAAKAHRVRGKKTNPRWYDDDDPDDSQHPSFQKIGKRK